MSEIISLHPGTLPQLDLKKSEQAKKTTKAEEVSSKSIDPKILKKALIPGIPLGAAAGIYLFSRPSNSESSGEQSTENDQQGTRAQSNTEPKPNAQKTEAPKATEPKAETPKAPKAAETKAEAPKTPTVAVPKIEIPEVPVQPVTTPPVAQGQPPKVQLQADEATTSGVQVTDSHQVQAVTHPVTNLSVSVPPADTPVVTPQTKVNEITFTPNPVSGDTENEEPVVVNTTLFRAPTIEPQTTFEPVVSPNVFGLIQPFDKNSSSCSLTMPGQHSDKPETETTVEAPSVPDADEITPEDLPLDEVEKPSSPTTPPVQGNNVHTPSEPVVQFENGEQQRGGTPLSPPEAPLSTGSLTPNLVLGHSKNTTSQEMTWIQQQWANFTEAAAPYVQRAGTFVNSGVESVGKPYGSLAGFIDDGKNQLAEQVPVEVSLWPKDGICAKVPESAHEACAKTASFFGGIYDSVADTADASREWINERVSGLAQWAVPAALTALNVIPTVVSGTRAGRWSALSPVPTGVAGAKGMRQALYGTGLLATAQTLVAAALSNAQTWTNVARIGAGASSATSAVATYDAGYDGYTTTAMAALPILTYLGIGLAAWGISNAIARAKYRDATA